MYNNISLYFSSDCNMQCQYCDINKHKPEMARNNVRVREQMRSGEYARNIISKFSSIADRITNISLWGMEPTINADLFEAAVCPLFDAFPNVDEVMFSTNSWLGYNRLKLFIGVLDQYNKEHNRHIRLDLQISLDGEPWLNDKSRRAGTTANTLEVIRDIVTQTPKDLSFDIKMHTKPTLDCEYMAIFNADHDKLISHFKFFDDLQTEMEALNQNAHITLQLAQTPTLVNPGQHTVEEGKILAEFIHNLRGIDTAQFKHFEHPLIFQPMAGLANARDLNSRDNFSHWGCCSSGRYTANIDSDGNLFSCHALFGHGYMSENQVIRAAQTTCEDGDHKRMQYIDLGWHEYPESKRQFVDIITYSLASAGQIDHIYLEDERWRKLLFYSMGGFYCQYGQMESTSSMWAFSTSWFKLMGNGALQEIMGYMKDCGMLGGE